MTKSALSWRNTSDSHMCPIPEKTTDSLMIQKPQCCLQSLKPLPAASSYSRVYLKVTCFPCASDSSSLGCKTLSSNYIQFHPCIRKPLALYLVTNTEWMISDPTFHWEIFWIKKLIQAISCIPAYLVKH